MSVPALILITTSFPITGDGSEAAGSFVSDLAEELAQQIPVRVVAPGTSSAREQWSHGVEVFRYPAPGKPLSTLKPWKPSELATIAHVWSAGARATRDAVHAGPTAHLLALWALPSGAWARSASRAMGVPYSVWTLGSDIWTLSHIPVVGRILRSVLRQAHICYSDGLELADDTQRVAARRVDFLPTTRRIQSSHNYPLALKPPYRLLFLGRWHPNKGVDLLLDALELLCNDDWLLIECVEIQGGGPLEALVAERVSALRAKGRPVEAGRFLDKTESEIAINRSSWVLIPSRIESIPLVFSDAMKLGRPVISTPVGDLTRLVREGGVGYVSRAITSEAFAKTMGYALQNAPERHGAALLAMAQRFDLGQTARRIISDLAVNATTGREPDRPRVPA